MTIYILVKKSLSDPNEELDVTVFNKLKAAQAQMSCEFLAEEEDALSRENIEEDGWEFHRLEDFSAIIKPFGSDFAYKWQIFVREL